MKKESFDDGIKWDGEKEFSEIEKSYRRYLNSSFCWIQSEISEDPRPAPPPSIYSVEKCGTGAPTPTINTMLF